MEVYRYTIGPDFLADLFIIPFHTGYHHDGLGSRVPLPRSQEKKDKFCGEALYL